MDGYIASGAKKVNSIKTANRVIRKTMNLIILFPIASPPSSRRLRGKRANQTGGAAGDQNTFLRSKLIKKLLNKSIIFSSMENC